MNPGTEIRLNRVFGRDGKSVVVAMDHGLAGMFPLGHLADPASLLAAIAEGGADAIPIDLAAAVGVARNVACAVRAKRGAELVDRGLNGLGVGSSG